MTQGEGYFIRPDGTAVRVFEHLSAVLKSPRRFGLTVKEVRYRDERERLDREAFRRRVLAAVIRHGFVRVRFSRDRRVAEFQRWAEAKPLLAGFLRQMRMTGGPGRLILREHATGQTWEAEARAICD